MICTHDNITARATEVGGRVVTVCRDGQSGGVISRRMWCDAYALCQRVPFVRYSCRPEPDVRLVAGGIL